MWVLSLAISAIVSSTSASAQVKPKAPACAKVAGQDQKFQDDALSAINWARTNPQEVARYIEEHYSDVFYSPSSPNTKYPPVSEIRAADPKLFSTYSDADVKGIVAFFSSDAFNQFIEATGGRITIDQLRKVEGGQALKNVPDNQVSALNKVVTSTGAKIDTQEGMSVVKDAIQFLKAQAPLKALAWNPYLAQKAKEMVAWQGAKGTTGHKRGNGKTYSEEKDWLNHGLECAGENLHYGSDDLKQIVIDLIIDDGVPTRGHRHNIYNANFTDIGVALGEHHSPYNVMCTQDFGCSDSGQEVDQGKKADPAVNNRSMTSPADQGNKRRNESVRPGSSNKADPRNGDTK